MFSPVFPVNVGFPFCVCISVMFVLLLTSLASYSKLGTHLSMPVLLWSSLFTNARWFNMDLGNQNTCVGVINTKLSQKTWKREREKYCPLSQTSLWKAAPFGNRVGWPWKQGRRKAREANFASTILTLASAPHLSGRLRVSGSPWTYSPPVGLNIFNKMH